MSWQGFVEMSRGFFAASDLAEQFRMHGLDSIDSVFAFREGEVLNKPGLADHRNRVVFQLDSPVKYYLKRYDRTPLPIQLQAWLDHGRRGAMSSFDAEPARLLAAAGIGTGKVVAYGQEWKGLFERRSFVITEEIANGRSLEERLPEYFYAAASKEGCASRRQFIDKLADFVRLFHETGFRHRDLYLCHIFLKDDGQLYLIDLHRTFKPLLFDERFRVKDITQLYYSAPGDVVSRSDRLRFYLRYVGREKLTRRDRAFLRKLKSRAWRMADHDIKHDRQVPFAS